MKKLITQTQTTKDVMYLSEITDKRIIGFLNSCGDKFFITPTKEYWVCIGLINFTTDIKLIFYSFEDLINSLKDKEDVFVFDTSLELFKWISN